MGDAPGFAGTPQVMVACPAPGMAVTFVGALGTAGVGGLGFALIVTVIVDVVVDPVPFVAVTANV